MTPFPSLINGGCPVTSSQMGWGTEVMGSKAPWSPQVQDTHWKMERIVKLSRSIASYQLIPMIGPLGSSKFQDADTWMCQGCRAGITTSQPCWWKGDRAVGTPHLGADPAAPLALDAPIRETLRCFMSKESIQLHLGQQYLCFLQVWGKDSFLMVEIVLKMKNGLKTSICSLLSLLT